MFNQNSGSYPDMYNPMTNPQYPQFGRGHRGGMIPNYNQFVPSTNKQFVRSLEEALSLPADFNSQNAYFDVNQNVIYDVCTNGRGEKSWAIFDIAPRQNSANIANATVASNAVDPYEERFKKIENTLEVLVNGKRDAKQTDTTNAGSV